MDDQFWHDKWHQNQIAFHQPQGHPALAKHWPSITQSTDKSERNRVLVPLAGKSVDILWLIQQGYFVVAIELSEKAVTDFFSDNQLTPTRIQTQVGLCYQTEHLHFYVGDFFDFTSDELGLADFWYDRAALIALPPDVRPRYASHLRTLVTDDASGLLIGLDYAGEKRQRPPYQVTEEEVASYFGKHYTVEIRQRIDLEEEAKRFSPDPTDPNAGWAQEAVYHIY